MSSWLCFTVIGVYYPYPLDTPVHHNKQALLMRQLSNPELHGLKDHMNTIRTDYISKPNSVHKMCANLTEYTLPKEEEDDSK